MLLSITGARISKNVIGAITNLRLLIGYKVFKSTHINFPVDQLRQQQVTGRAKTDILELEVFYHIKYWRYPITKIIHNFPTSVTVVQSEAES
jgi:hypothetical protein